MIAEVAFIFVLYGARVTTFIEEPGRFRDLEPVLGSDKVVFFAAPILAIFALGRLFSGHLQIGKLVSYGLAVFLSGAAAFVAVAVSLGTWGM